MKLSKTKLSMLVAGLLPILLCVNVRAADVTPSTTVTTTTEASLTDTQDPAVKQQNTVVTTTMDNLADGSSKKVVETTRKMITPVPAPKETVSTPEGYVSCFTVEANWFKNLWVPTHKVCQYENTGEGAAWIEGYWGCNKATAEGICSNWEWKAGHWEKTLAVY